ncbi:MAG: Glucose-6-phosphate isomerase, partial [uncultured Corynebacteriales bacterium]
ARHSEQLGVEGAAGPPREGGATAPARAVRDRSGPGPTAHRRGGRAVPGLLQAPDHRGDRAAARRAGRAGRAAGEDRRDVLRRAHQHLRGPGGAAHRAAAAPRRRAGRRRAGRRGGRARHPGGDGRVRRQGPVGGVDRGDRPADLDRGQHRDRRLRPRPGHGVRGAAAVRRRRDQLPLRLQPRPGRPVREHQGPRPGQHAVRRLLQDVHDAGDADQRDRGPALAARRARVRRRRRRGQQALRRGVDQRREGRRVRDRHRQHVRLLGLGRRPLLGRLGGGPVGAGRDRQGALRRVPGRVPHRRRALPHRAAGPERTGAGRPARRLVLELFRRPVQGRPAVLHPPVAVPGVPAAADDGVQRQVGAVGRLAGGDVHRRDLLGRARHQRPACLLPAAAPGHLAGALRLHRLRPVGGPDRPGGHARPAHRELPGPAGGAGVRADRRGAGGRRHPGRRGPAQGHAGQPALDGDPGRAADPVGAGPADRPVRARRLHRGRDLGHRLLRPVGRAARQGQGDAAHPGTDRRGAAGVGRRPVHHRPGAALPRAQRPL